MTFEVLLSPEAQQDVKLAYRYIAEHGPANPDDWKAGLDVALASLETFPHRCSKAPESRIVGEAVYQLLYTSFRLLFIIDKQHVLVVAMWHGARLPLTKEQMDDRLDGDEKHER